MRYGIQAAEGNRMSNSQVASTRATSLSIPVVILPPPCRLPMTPCCLFLRGSSASTVPLSSSTPSLPPPSAPSVYFLCPPPSCDGNFTRDSLPQWVPFDITMVKWHRAGGPFPALVTKHPGALISPPSLADSDATDRVCGDSFKIQTRGKKVGTLQRPVAFTRYLTGPLAIGLLTFFRKSPGVYARAFAIQLQ